MKHNERSKWVDKIPELYLAWMKSHELKTPWVKKNQEWINQVIKEYQEKNPNG